ncbi:MAG: patatin-like phospholipase family protein [Pseudoflavonifractor sp.]|nr:patatin-like phospholipase family protein [Pseudoflavonifractor sp.]
MTHILRFFRAFFPVFLLCAIFPGIALAVNDSSCHTVDSAAYAGRQSVGLVLSGGGAKGVAHIGVIKALEDHQIPIDYVAGTSMGAIVGGLYAAGYTPEEMIDLILSPTFTDWSTGRINPSLTWFYSRPEPTPAMVTINLGDNGNDSGAPTSFLPSSLISPLPMNFGVMELFSAYTAQSEGNFDKLFIPFRCVTSDVYAKHKVVCRGGSFGDAIRASMSFPLVFHPIEMDGTLMYDGGIYDNFPVDVMRADFAPDIMIGVDVTNPDTKPKVNDIVQQVEDMVIQNNDYSLPADEGVKIKVDVSQFSLLDFGKAREIYARGYEKAMEMMDSIERRVTSRIPSQTRQVRRDVFKDRTPYLTFDSVHVSGGNPGQNAYLRYIFTHNSPDTFGISRARDSYYRAISSGQIQNLLPQAVRAPGDSLFTLDLQATVKNNFRVGFGGYISSSTSSYLFFSGGYNTLSTNSFDAALNAWVGQSYLAADASAKFTILTHTPSYLLARVVLSRHKYHEDDDLFFDSATPNFVTHDEAFGRLNYCLAAGRRGKFNISLGLGHLVDRYYRSFLAEAPSPSDDYGRDRATRTLGQLSLGYERNTLDNTFYPTSGLNFTAYASGILGSMRHHPYGSGRSIKERPARVEARLTALGFPISRKHYALGLESNIVASTRSLPHDYSTAIVTASAFNPTPSSYNAFNPAFRADSYVTAGLIPVWKMSELIQVRGTFHCFLPFRRIEEGPDHDAVYGRWFHNPRFFGEAAAIVNLPFAAVTAYANYMSYPSRNWNFGLSLGIFILAPKFLR